MSSLLTVGVRTWRRTGADASASVSDRVVETTRPDAMPAAIASADFVTIPRESDAGSGYGPDYAATFGAALAARFGYVGARRVSASGRSHVFEREAAPQGAAVDLGVATDDADGPGARSLPRTAGDGSALGRPALAVR